MAHAFKLSVVAPDRTVVETETDSVIVPSVNGYAGIWAGHAPMIAALRPGLVEYRDRDNQIRHVAVGRGFVETSGDGVIVLADHAAAASEIDVAEAEEMLERARKALRGEQSDLTPEQATEQLELAMSRIRASKRS